MLWKMEVRYSVWRLNIICINVRNQILEIYATGKTNLTLLTHNLPPTSRGHRIRSCRRRNNLSYTLRSSFASSPHHIARGQILGPQFMSTVLAEHSGRKELRACLKQHMGLGPGWEVVENLT